MQKYYKIKKNTTEKGKKNNGKDISNIVNIFFAILHGFSVLNHYFCCQIMFQLHKIINKTLSVRFSLMVVSAMTLLLMTSLVFMLHYSRKAIKEEALQNASQTLDVTISRIDNILLSVEQTTGNFYYQMYSDLNNPQKMAEYSRRLVEANPYIEGCAIAFAPNHFRDCDSFIVYHYRTVGNPTQIVRMENVGKINYTEMYWYKQAIETGKSGWINPMKDIEDISEPIITFCLPFINTNKETIAVMGVDVSLSLLSHLVLESKPSPNSYCTILNSDGKYIVHPDSTKLFYQIIYTQGEYKTNADIRKAANALLSGQNDYMEFTRNGISHFIFYKPFTRSNVRGRSMEALDWYIGIIYPEDDIFGDYNILLYHVLAIAFIGMLLMYVLCRFIIRRQLIPLRMLTASAQRIAEGKFDEHIPPTHHHDEISQLQEHFRKMQQSLGSIIGELEQGKITLQERGEGLKRAYEEAQKADRLKTSFLHNMTNQMISPAEDIEKDVEKLCDTERHMTSEETGKMTDDIRQKGDEITRLLDNLINMSEEDMKRKGALYE